jgi:FMN-binding domain
MTRTQHVGLVTGAALMASLFAHAESIYQEPPDFIAETFRDESPETSVLWINNNIRKEAQTILGRDLRPLRIRYWQKGERTAWILDEIGKDLPITTGVVIESGAIKSIKVLVFRESRGWEVRYPFFTDQFNGARIDAKNRLDKQIDNISGATLSVNALKRQAQLALLLSTYIN